MKVTLQKVRPSSGAILECLPFLDNSAQQTVTSELERTAFQRMYADLHFTLSNLSDTFTTYFRSLARTDLLEVCVYDDTNRRRFWGHVDSESVTFRLRDKWVDFDAFSTMKRFWELAKLTELYQPSVVGLGGWFDTTVTLSNLLNYQAVYTPIRDGGTTFSAINLGDYASVLVRGYRNSTDYGNQGRFQDLKPGTTWFEYLNALALFFNAEFYIDPETYEFRMVQRGTVLSNTLTDLDVILMDDEEATVRLLDSKTCDYIYSFGSLPTSPPAIARYEPAGESFGGRNGLAAGVHAWIITFVIGGSECLRTERVEFTLPSAGAPHKVWLDIPLGPVGCTGRRLYRKDANDRTGTFRQVKYWNDNTTISTYDTTGIALLAVSPVMPYIVNTVWGENAWYSFDEKTNIWGDPVIDIPKGVNKPTGIILDITPQLLFTEPGNPLQVLEYDGGSVYKHFLANFNIDESATRTRWVDVFRTRRIIGAKVNGTAFDIGDSFVSAKNLFPNDFTTDNRMILRKAESELLSKTSRLSLMTI